MKVILIINDSDASRPLIFSLIGFAATVELKSDFVSKCKLNKPLMLLDEA